MSSSLILETEREWGNSVQLLKKPTDKNAVYPHSTMNFHSRVGNLVPNSQQLVDGTVTLKGS
jgi:hypothetical protein